MASSDASSTVTQNRPGATRCEHAAIGVEREREQEQHDEPERQDLLERDARAHLDAQVLAGDEEHLAPEHHGATSSSVVDVVRRRGAQRRRRRRSAGSGTVERPPRREHDLAVGEWPRVLELVRREQHGTTVARRTPDDLVERRAALLVEPGVGLVEQQERRLAREREAEREPASLTCREPSVEDVAHGGEPEPFECGVGDVDRASRRAWP